LLVEKEKTKKKLDQAFDLSIAQYEIVSAKFEFFSIDQLVSFVEIHQNYYRRVTEFIETLGADVSEAKNFSELV